MNISCIRLPPAFFQSISDVKNRLAEDDPSVLGGKGSQVYLFGVCQGAIPATVAAAARDTSSIVTFGVEAVAIVFRLAVHLMRRTKNVEDSEESWICTVHGADPDDVQKLLDKFNEVCVEDHDNHRSLC